jgi:general secretion pathway protein C
MMDVAKRLADWTDQPPKEWFSSINRYLPPGISALLVIAIAYQLATLTWTLPGSAPAVAPAVRGESTTAPAADFSVLTDSRLFGEASTQVVSIVPAVIAAPDTTLRLTLTGILAKEDDANGGATIASDRDGSQNYQVGQVIAGADGATLHAVYADRVLLNRNGRLETLRFPKELSTAGSSMDQRSRSPQPVPSASLREAISENTTQLTDIIRPTLHVQEGQIVGFRVNPGRDRAAFEALGLQPGDVVTDINGTVLDDPSQGLQLFQSLRETTQANVTVLRDGVPQVIVIDTRELQGLEPLTSTR